MNADLTWRDVKLLLAGSARQNDADHSEWASGAAKYGNPTSKYQFNPNYGFGLVDAGAAVALAQNWVNLPPMATSVVKGDPIKIPDRASGDAEVVERTFRVENDGLTTPTFIEHVEVRMGIRHGAANDLSVDLVSPSGVVSKLLWHEPGAIRQGVIFTAYALGSSRYLGENPTGEWTLRVADHVSGDSGSIHSLSLVVRGHRPNNSQATGLPTIGGTAQVDYTLTADTSAIADGDGMTNAVFSYQWIAGETDISGATGSSYTLTSGEVGQFIKVTVSYTDDAGNLEHLTSAPTDPVRAGPTISGTAQVDETLTADTSAIADADGMTNAVFSYQWIAGETDISGATGSSYTLTSSEQGKTIRVTVSYTDDAGNLEHLTSAATGPVAARPNRLATGVPTISGTAQVNYALTADTSEIADEDGLTNVSYTYQWVSNDGCVETDIRDATDSTHTLNASDERKTIQVKVSFTDDAGHQETLTSAATTMVAPQSANTVEDGVVPLWSACMSVVDYGTGAIGAGSSDLFSNVGGGAGLQAKWLYYYAPGRSLYLSLTDGLPDEGLELHVGDVAISFPAESSGNSGFTWNDVDADWQGGQNLPARIVQASPPIEEDSEDQQQGDQSSNTLATGAPTVDGTARVGEKLTADTSAIADADGLTNVSYSYQWIWSDGNDDADIEGQTGLTYTLVSADEGKTIQVRVTFTDDADNQETLTSVATVVVVGKPNTAATGAPTISGTAQVREPLTAATSDIADEDGLDDVSYSYRWVVNDGTTDTDILNATASIYTPSVSDVGQTITVKVSFTDDGDHAETLTSAATDAVLAAVPTGPLSLTVTRGGQIQELDVSWQAPASNGGSDVTGYKVQWKEAADSWDTAADVSEATVSGTTHTITELTGGQEYTVRVIATNAAGDGPASTEVKGTPAGGVSEQNTEPENTAPTGLPSISGTPQVDQTLTAATSDIADEDGLDDVSYSYQWVANDGTTDTDILNATALIYTPSVSDVGKAIKVKVSFTDDADNQETLTSVATDAVAATKPGVPGHLNVSSQDTGALDVYWEAPASDGGSDVTGYRVQWKKTTGSWDTAADVSEATVTGTTHTITGLTDGVEYRVRVMGMNDVGEGLPSAERSGIPRETRAPEKVIPRVNGGHSESAVRRGPGRGVCAGGKCL